MVDIDWRSFGERVLLSRRRLQLSQAAFAKAIGISRNYVSMIERGQAEPSYTIVTSICQRLKIALPGMNVAMNVADDPKNTPNSAS